MKLNLELAATSEIVGIACRVKPDQATLVPERREEVTTEGGLDVVGNRQAVATAIKKMRDAGIYVSLFLDPDPKQLDLAKEFRSRGGGIAHGELCERQGGEATGCRISEADCSGKANSRVGFGFARGAWAELSERAADCYDRGDA